MQLVQAYELIARATGSLQLTRNEHDQILQALAVMKTLVETEINRQQQQRQALAVAAEPAESTNGSNGAVETIPVRTRNKRARTK